ncbi:MAG: PAS domain S-box protein [Candidatus Eisenbacteria bacterium]
MTLRRHRHREIGVKRDLDRVGSYIETAGAAIAVIDGNERVTFMNTEACAILGRDKHEVLGRNWFDGFLPEETREDLRTAFQLIIDGRTELDKTVEYPVLTRNGETRLMAWHRTLLRDESGKIVSVLNLGEDITERKRTDDLNAILRELGMALSTVSNLEYGLKVCLEAALGASGMDCGGICLIDETSGALDLVFHQGLSPEFINSASHFDADSKNTRIVMAGKPVYTTHGALQDVFGVHLAEGERHERLKALAVIPMSCEGRVIGCVNVASHKFRDVPVGSHAALETISAEIGSAIVRLRAERAQQESEQRFRDLAENASEWIWEVDAEGRYTYSSPLVKKVLGYGPEEVLGKHFYDFFVPEEREFLKQAALAVFASKEPFRAFVNRNIHRNGEVRWLSTSGVPILDSDGNLRGYRGIDTDISERKWVEDELICLSSAVRASIDAIVVSDVQGKITEANDAALSMFGAGHRSDLIGMNALDLFAPEDRKEAAAGLDTTFKTGYTRAKEYEIITLAGARIPAEITTSVMKDVNGEPTGIVGVVRDITERRQTENALRESEERYRDLFENANDLIQSVAPDGHFIYVNRAWRETLGYSEEEVGGLNLFDIIDPDWHEHCRQVFEQVMSGEPACYIETVFISRDGRKIIAEGSASCRTQDGKPVSTRAIFRDVTTRKYAEEALRHSERDLRIRNAIAHVFLTAPENEVFTEVMKIVLKAVNSTHGLFGYICRTGDLVCLSVTKGIVKEDLTLDVGAILPREKWSGIWGRALTEKRLVCSGPAADITEDRAPVCKTVAAPIIHNDRVIGLIMVANKPDDYDDDDVRLLETTAGNIAPILHARLERDGEEDARKQAEKDKAGIRAQLIHAQKMDAIGTLAGGIAHDFNDLLSTIQGCSELALQKTSEEDPVRNDLDQIREATQRAADLARQLLLFSRQQPMETSLIDLNKVTTNMLEMLGRLISENIEVDFHLDPDLPVVRGDRSNMEQVIMNLVLNARDAMPGGGKIIITTESVTLDENQCAVLAQATPGKYVCITVTDEGIGMDSDTLEHIFEPFFSTNVAGEGAGLGLAVVHSIIQQHEGWIDAYSEPGNGATFKVYFKAFSATIEEKHREKSSLKNYQGNGETILSSKMRRASAGWLRRYSAPAVT